jgi:hypothetical protein
MADPQKEQAKESLVVTAKKWGGSSNTMLLALCNTVDYFSEYLLTLLTENPVPPALLATLVFAQHARPFQPLPMLFPPLLLFSTYLNLQGFKIDSAGTTAALSGAYLVLAGRRRMGFVNKFGARGIIRGATMGLCLVNLVGGGLAYSFGSRTKEDDKRKSL